MAEKVRVATHLNNLEDPFKRAISAEDKMADFQKAAMLVDKGKIRVLQPPVAEKMGGSPTKVMEEKEKAPKQLSSQDLY